MSCGLDFGCHVAGLFAPVAAFWAAWDWLAWFVVGLVIGGILGWRVVLAVITLGIGYFLYDRFRKSPEPDYETGEPPEVPKKRRTLQDIFGGR